MENPVHIIDVLLMVLLSASAFSDILKRKVYNAVTFPAVILGIFFQTYYFSWAGLINSLLGLITGFAILFVFFLIKAVGAGDVKFLAAVGAVMGWRFVIFGAGYGIILAGIAALVVLVAQGRLTAVIEIIKNFFRMIVYRQKSFISLREQGTTKLPYAVFLAAGFLIRWLEITVILR